MSIWGLILSSRHYRNFSVFGSLLGLLFVGACATQAPKPVCLATQYAQWGQRDGERGLPKEEYRTHALECQADSPDMKALYEEKWAAAVQKYCTKEEIYKHGLEGHVYLFVCPRSQEDEILTYFNRGRETFVLKKKDRELAQQIRDLARRLESEELSPLQKQIFHKDIAHLKVQLAETEMRLRNIEGQRAPANN